MKGLPCRPELMAVNAEGAAGIEGADIVLAETSSDLVLSPRSSPPSPGNTGSLRAVCRMTMHEVESRGDIACRPAPGPTPSRHRCGIARSEKCPDRPARLHLTVMLFGPGVVLNPVGAPGTVGPRPIWFTASFDLADSPSELTAVIR